MIKFILPHGIARNQITLGALIPIDFVVICTWQYVLEQCCNIKNFFDLIYQLVSKAMTSETSN